MITQLREQAEDISDQYYAKMMKRLTDRVFELEGRIPEPAELEAHGDCRQAIVPGDLPGDPERTETTWFWKGAPVLIGRGPETARSPDGSIQTSWILKEPKITADALTRIVDATARVANMLTRTIEKCQDCLMPIKGTRTLCQDNAIVCEGCIAARRRHGRDLYGTVTRSP